VGALSIAAAIAYPPYLILLISGFVGTRLFPLALWHSPTPILYKREREGAGTSVSLQCECERDCGCAFGIGGVHAISGLTILQARPKRCQANEDEEAENPADR